jgi:hypothetical protein
VTERIFRAAYKHGKLNKPFYEFERCNKLDIRKVHHSNVSCANMVRHISEEIRKNLVTALLKRRPNFVLLFDEAKSHSSICSLTLCVRARVCVCGECVVRKICNREIQ